MKIFLNIVAILLVLVGVIWFLQGMNVLSGGAMAGQSQWTIIGIVAFLIGVGLFIFSNRKKSLPPQSN